MGKDFVDDILKARHKKPQPDPVSIPSGEGQRGQDIQNSRDPENQVSRIPETKNSRNPDIKKSRIPENKKEAKKVKIARVNVNLNLEKKLIERAKIQAVKEGRPFSRLIETAIDEYMKGR